MKVLIVSRGYPPLVGGIETQTRIIANRLARRHCVEVAALAFCEGLIPPWYSGKLNKSAILTKEAIKQSFRRTQAFIALQARIKTFRELKHEDLRDLLLPRRKSHCDGEVMVHSLSPSMIDQLRIRLHFAARLLGRPLQDQAHYRAFIYHFFRSIFVTKLKILMRDKDVIHCVADGYLGWAAEEAARAEGLPFVLTPFIHPGHHGEDDANVHFYRRADLVFALLETGRQRLVELGVQPEKLRLLGVIPLLPDTTDPRGFRNRHKLGGEPIILFVGRIVEYKGVAALLDAASRVWREIPRAHFVFIGPTSTDVHLQRRLVEHADERVRYLGQVSEQEKGDALAACDLFCMPSTAEILPAVYLEAWSYGKAVVGGTAHGLRELIEGNGGGIVVEQNPELIANRLIDLLRDEDKRRQMGERGRCVVEQRFSDTAICGAIEAAYEDLCLNVSHRLDREAGWLSEAQP